MQELEDKIYLSFSLSLTLREVILVANNFTPGRFDQIAVRTL